MILSRLTRATSKRRDGQRLIPVRALAEYSADPKRYKRYRGKIRNKAAVRAGNLGEARMSSTNTVTFKRFFVTAIAVGFLVWLLSQ